MNVLIKLESELKKQYELDLYDPNMYVTIKNLTEKILVVKKLIDNRADIERVAHDYATSLWIRLCDGLVVQSWTKYIMLNVSSALQSYYKTNNKPKIDIVINDPVDEELFLTRMYGTAVHGEYIRDYEVHEYISSIYEDIKDLVIKYSRTTNMITNRYLYLSVLANFTNTKSLIGLSSDQKNYVSMITNLVKKKVYEDSIGLINTKDRESLSKILSNEKLEEVP